MRPTSDGSISPIVRPVSAASVVNALVGVAATPNTAMAQRATASSSSSSTAATAPAMAKSPWRRANSATPNPHRPRHTGKEIERRSSPSSSAVDHTPVKKSAAGTDLAPPLDTTSNDASRATATAGYSAAGSAWTSEPPIVPLLRIWK